MQTTSGGTLDNSVNKAHSRAYIVCHKDNILYEAKSICEALKLPNKRKLIESLDTQDKFLLTKAEIISGLIKVRDQSSLSATSEVEIEQGNHSTLLGGNYYSINNRGGLYFNLRAVLDLSLKSERRNEVLDLLTAQEGIKKALINLLEL